jgi:predicted DNA-binding transcriptional regulator AlpA
MRQAVARRSEPQPDRNRTRTSGVPPAEAAKLLGVGRRTIMGYLNKDELPPVVAIACRALARDKHLLAAHYVPARKITRPAA